MAAWQDKDGGSSLKLANGLFEFVIEYVYSERPGLRIMVCGARRTMLAKTYTDIVEAKKDAMSFARKFGEEYQIDLVSVDKK